MLILVLSLVMQQNLPPLPPPVVSYIKPTNFRNVVFKGGERGFSLDFELKKNQFKGKVPSVIDFWVFGPPVGHLESNTKKAYHFGDHNKILNYRNKEVKVTIFFYEDPKNFNWKFIKIKLKTQHLREKTRLANIFVQESCDIEGVVGAGSEGIVQLAKNVRNIDEIKKLINKLAKECKIEGGVLYKISDTEYPYEWKKQKGK